MIAAVFYIIFRSLALFVVEVFGLPLAFIEQPQSDYCKHESTLLDMVSDIKSAYFVRRLSFIDYSKR